ncbi:pyridoxal-dependent decarboxylase, exosortase A system-associated [Sphingomonas montanisoli]|uniref:Pyridoxal-dependent decarboxylase, exosortase A system-associated n=1 Tax=Sphingomonas montanisoli TaxID=2606412 RepID=A0A5D9CBL1_9SPHN|nr:pyridoxal-dependent decarboxylase, exosortase A system-associated [Sphingomonas montanisoli]TZG29124.1 pyridoxal-dependent decarboxylase, exosortase A system-associated [Sphingomonas montanisoli]
MKPTGPIPEAFASADQLMIGGKNVLELADIAGDTPFFAYDIGLIRHRVARFRAAFPQVALHYAVKANPHRPLVRAIAAMVDGIDVASEGEARIALDAGMASRDISFAGPGKRERELETAIRAGITINLESEGEAERALAIGDRLAIRPRLAVRVNPDFDLKGSGMKMGGGAKPFGIDAERVPALIGRIVAAGADYSGLHIFAGSQALMVDAIVEAQVSALALAAGLSNEAQVLPPLVNLGGGFGVPYFAGDKPLDIEAIGIALAEALAARDPILADTAFAIELGRWIVAEAGVYLTRVVDRKVSHGETFLVVDGGLHHQLAASGNFGTVVRRNYPIANAARIAAPVEEEVSVVGCLCTPLDLLGNRVGLPRTEVGDVIAIFMAGAYGASASPQSFLGHPPPVELTIDGGEIL